MEADGLLRLEVGGILCAADGVRVFVCVWMDDTGVFKAGIFCAADLFCAERVLEEKEPCTWALLIEVREFRSKQPLDFIAISNGIVSPAF